MAELWPFIKSLVKKWQLEERNFTFSGLLLKLTMDSCFLLLHHSNRNFMVSNNSVGLIAFILWLFIQRLALKASCLAFAFTVRVFYNVYAG